MSCKFVRCHVLGHGQAKHTTVISQLSQLQHTTQTYSQLRHRVGRENTDTEAGGVWDLSNVRRLGVTEAELVRGVYSAVTKIIDEEEKLT